MNDPGLAHVRKFALTSQAHTQALRDLAVDADWAQIADVPRGHRAFRRLVWRVPDGGKVHYFEDHWAGCRFLTLDAASVASLDRLVTLTGAALALEDERAMLGRLEAAEEPAGIIATLLTL